MYVLVLYDPKAEEKKLLKSKAKCNRWGEWIRKTQCPICGNGSRQYFISTANVGSIFTIVVVSLRLHADFGRNDHREERLQFMTYFCYV